MDLKQQLQRLILLQSIDSQMHVLAKEKESLPSEIKVLETEFESKKESLAQLDKKNIDLQKQKKDHELELGVNEEARKKLQGQLFQLKTNKEYHAMLQQIEGSKANASVIEEKILLVMDQMDEVKAKVIVEKSRLAEEEKKLNERKKVVTDKIKGLDEQLHQLVAQRIAALDGVDKKILTQYERILQSRDSLALAPVLEDSCGGCHMRVTPQMINLIKMYESIITCEVCNRMLYIRDEQA